MENKAKTNCSVGRGFIGAVVTEECRSLSVIICWVYNNSAPHLFGYKHGVFIILWVRRSNSCTLLRWWGTWCQCPCARPVFFRLLCFPGSWAGPWTLPLTCFIQWRSAWLHLSPVRSSLLLPSISDSWWQHGSISLWFCCWLLHTYLVSSCLQLSLQPFSRSVMVFVINLHTSWGRLTRALQGIFLQGIFLQGLNDQMWDTLASQDAWVLRGSGLSLRIENGLR